LRDQSGVVVVIRAESLKIEVLLLRFGEGDPAGSIGRTRGDPWRRAGGAPDAWL